MDQGEKRLNGKGEEYPVKNNMVGEEGGKCRTQEEKMDGG